MSGSNLIRWAGLSLLVSGVLVALGFILHPPEEVAAVSSSLWAIAHLLVLVSFWLGMLSLFGLYARQVAETGVLGLIGFILVFITMASLTGIIYFEAFIDPVLAVEAPEFVEARFAGEISRGAFDVIVLLTGLLLILGWLLFGIGIIRAGILPRWAAVLALIGAVPIGLLPLLPSFIIVKIFAVVFGLGLAWLGYALWSEKPATATTAAI